LRFRMLHPSMMPSGRVWRNVRFPPQFLPSPPSAVLIKSRHFAKKAVAARQLLEQLLINAIFDTPANHTSQPCSNRLRGGGS
jgi:hypothetical protein